MASRRTNHLRQYLSDTGVLESEDEELIRAVKAAYWRNYHKQYKREKRSREQEYSIALDKGEKNVLEQEAGRHKESLPSSSNRPHGHTRTSHTCSRTEVR